MFLMIFTFMKSSNKLEFAVFGGGCFWCTEAVFRNLKGIKSVVPGYAGGNGINPSYEEVCSGKTGHAEVIKIEFDPKQISYKELLEVFFSVHDPTTLNRQGNDVGTQYRSIILYANNIQHEEALQFIKKLESSKIYKHVVTEVKPLNNFYKAEDYHNNYYNRNMNQSYCQLVINPKLAKFRKDFAKLIKDNKL